MLSNLRKKETDSKIEIIETNEDIQLDEIKEPVKNATSYFTVQSCVNKYLGYIVEKNADALYSILDNSYIEKNNIDANNVLDKVEKYDESITFKAESMGMEQLDDNNIKYYAEGIIRRDAMVENYEDEKNQEIVNDNFKIVVILNTEKKIFSIIPM